MTDWLIDTIPKKDNDRVMLWATVKAVITLTKWINPVTKKMRHIRKTIWSIPFSKWSKPRLK